MVKKPRVLVVGQPYNNESINSALLKLVLVLVETSSQVYVVAGNCIHNPNVKSFEVHGSNSIYKYMYNFFILQFRIIAIIHNFDYDLVFFFPQPFIFLAIYFKLKRKKVIFMASGRITKNFKNRQISLKKYIFIFIDFMVTNLANIILVQSKSVITSLELEKHKHKIIIYSQLIDTDKFDNTINVNDRENIIGYIGSLNKIKGTDNLIRAIKIFYDNSSLDYKFWIVGGGDINELKDYIGKDLDNENKVEFKGWIKNSEIPEILNNIKLLILPSISEGLANVILEAMACGTPVLATSVGGTPDVIKDCETGFIMSDNSPESIFQNIIRAICYPELETISKNARNLIEYEFTFDAAVKRMQNIVNIMCA